MKNEFLLKKIEDSKKIIKLAAEMSLYYYQKPLIITYSGGKDSDVLLQLALECLEPSEFEVLNSHTTVDAPETVYYIREKFKELNEKGIKTEIYYSRYKDGTMKTMWNLIEKKGLPPTRIQRYCCAELKETSTPNRFVATGVRKAESIGRRGRDVFATRGKTKKEAYYYYYSHVREVFDDAKARTDGGGKLPNDESVYDCTFITKAKRKENLICNPIYEWTDSEIWEFIQDRKMKYNPLYDKGFYRVGCIGCPLAGKEQKRELQLYPIYAENYKKAFQRMLDSQNKKSGMKNKKYSKLWKDGESVFKWWIEDDTIEGQMSIDEFIKQEE